MNQQLKDGVPCSHPHCLHHVSHPCEGCGRIAGRAVNQQEQLDTLAEQNRLLREALKDAVPDMLNDARRTLNTYGVADSTIYEAEKKAKLARKYMELNTLPDLSTSILNQRDARTIREAVCVCEELLLGRSTFSTDEVFGIRCCIKEIERLAAEKEK